MRPVILIIVLTLGVITLLVWTRPDNITASQVPPITRVLTTEIKSADIQIEKTLSGILQAAQTAHLRFEVPGLIQERYVMPGQSVAAGETLLALDEVDYVNAVDEARAQLQLEQEAITKDTALLAIVVQQHDLLAKELARLETLAKSALASISERDNTHRQWLQSKTEKAQLSAQLSSAKARITIRQIALRQAQKNLARTRLQAPFAGVINQVSWVPGDYASPGEIAIELVQVNELDVALEVNGETAKYLHLGMQIPVTIDGHTHKGKIVTLNIAPDQSTNTHGLQIRLSGRDLYPGLIVQATLPGAYISSALLVPSSSILYNEGHTYVFEVIDQRIQRHAINIVHEYGEQQIITGLSAGRHIVQQDVYMLDNGQQVIPHTASSIR